MSSIASRWEGSIGWLGWIEKLFKIGRGRSAKINELIYALTSQIDRLEEVVYRLRERDRELFDRAVKSYLKKDLTRAMIYAGEVAEIRKIVKVILSTQLALEQVKVRLETLKEVKNIAIDLSPVVSLIQGLKGELSGVVPQVAMELEELSRTMNEIMIESGSIPEAHLEHVMAGEEAKKIMEEARSVAELKIKEMFPELPIPIAGSGKEVSAEKTSTPLAEAKPRIKKITRNELDNLVLKHIIKNNGFLDVNTCAKEIGVDKKHVLESLERLKKQGKISLPATA